jgi:hypothetical protein
VANRLEFLRILGSDVHYFHHCNVAISMRKETTHGGKRKNSGRKKREPTEVRRIPVSLLPKVDKLIADHRAKKK